MSELVTGDAVVLELRLARTASRALALAIDLLVQATVLAVALVLLVIGLPSIDSALAAALTLVSMAAVLVGYPVLFETLSRGRTLGKMALGLRVVRDDGGPIRFRHALVRGLAGFFVDFWLLLGTIAVFVSLFSNKGKRVGDLLAGTVVIRERVPRPQAGMVTMPPPLAGWAAGLDLSRLPDDLALAIRQYLGRFHQLSPRARDGLGWNLAIDVSQHIGVPVPPGVPVAAYLAAVLAQRRAREQARLTVPRPWQTTPPVVPMPPTPTSQDSPFIPPS